VEERYDVQYYIYLYYYIYTQYIAQSPNLRRPKPRFNARFTPPLFYITNAGGEPRVKPGVW
jgi:hypothetical protein